LPEEEGIAMDIATSTLWWVAAGVLVAVELATGTFYLLMMALGMAAAALAAQLGLTVTGQIVVAALVGSGATALWHLKRKHQPSTAPARENRDVNLDIGETLHIAEWSPDRTARIPYRGTTWTARLEPGAPPFAGPHVVSAVEGNWLVLSPAASNPRPATEPLTDTL
jgi:membrane protein implicated in regulation of membrane protease activity